MASDYEQTLSCSIILSDSLPTATPINTSTLLDVLVYFINNDSYISFNDIEDVLILREDEILSIFAQNLSEFSDIVDYSYDDLESEIDYDKDGNWKSGNEALEAMIEKSKAYEKTLPTEEEFLEFQKRYPPRARYIPSGNVEAIGGHDISRANVVDYDDYDLVSRYYIGIDIVQFSY